MVIVAVWHFGYDSLILVRGWSRYEPAWAALASWLMLSVVQLVGSVLLLRTALRGRLAPVPDVRRTAGRHRRRRDVSAGCGDQRPQLGREHGRLVRRTPPDAAPDARVGRPPRLHRRDDDGGARGARRTGHPWRRGPV
ncbi:hypothetical protein LV779_27200 [Streptomyces thinghirensis]|nr:hypothetical protein [Streptomyces thinghirensis]